MPIDAVNERAVEINQEDQFARRLSPVLELRSVSADGRVRAFAHLIAPVIIGESDRLASSTRGPVTGSG
jgi:hypothetical protein